MQGTDKTGGPVAIKVFKGVFPETTIKEAELVAKCAHRNVVKYMGFERLTVQDNSFYERYAMAMELCDCSAKTIIERNKNGLESSEFFSLCRQLVNALEHLHSLHVIHRDIKPDNVLVVNDGNQNTYKLGDFGTARILQDDESYSSMHGTYEYVHPKRFEQFNLLALDIERTQKYEFDERHELWSVGVFLYQAVTGELPFNPKNRRTNKRQMYNMISAKKDGDIAAKETELGVQWQNQLPESAKIDNKEEVALFLAGLLKVSFKRFILLHICF